MIRIVRKEQVSEMGPGTKAENGAIEWSRSNAGAVPLGLTESEENALRHKHQSNNPNFKRALEVKRLMGEGRSCVQIICALRSRYGSRQIKADHAALSALKKR